MGNCNCGEDHLDIEKMDWGAELGINSRAGRSENKKRRVQGQLQAILTVENTEYFDESENRDKVGDIIKADIQVEKGELVLSRNANLFDSGHTESTLTGRRDSRKSKPEDQTILLEDVVSHSIMRSSTHQSVEKVRLRTKGTRLGTHSSNGE